VDETGQVLEENPASLPFQPGQPFDSEAVRAGLRQLFRSGRYADLRAETSLVAGGVRLDFVAQRNFYVNLVRVTGLREPPGEPLAIASMRLGLGEAFRESDLKEALERLRQTLRDDGFYQAELIPELLPHPDTRQMDITVRVTPGPRARLSAIELRNHTEFPDAELLRRSRLKLGREITSRRLDRAAERVRKFLAGKDYLGARATLHRGSYDPKTQTLPLAMEVISGPKVRVEVAGAKIPAKDLRKLVPIYQEGAVDEDLLQEGRRAIRDYLEREGYFDAQVSYTAAEPAAHGEQPGRKPPDQVVTYQVERGPRRRLVGVAFEGNKYFNDDLLLGRLRTQPAAILSRGRFSQRLLQDDVASIRDLYAVNGFREAEVRSELAEGYRGKEGDLFVRLHVSEGPQTLVADLKLEGNHALSDETLLSVIGSSAGQPYSEFNVSGDRDNILALYYNDGFPEARFTAETQELAAPGPAAGSGPKGSPATPAVQAHRVRLLYHIVEGPQVRVGRLLVSGYEHTRAKVVEREVQVKADEPLREGDVVETQRRLYNLGVFSRVAVAPQNPAGTDPDKTVVVLVDEAKRYTLGYGLGVEVQRLGGGGADPVSGQLRASPRAIFEITKNNLTGRADSLSFKARASTLQGRALLSYTEPNVFSQPEFSLQITGFGDKTRDIRTFTSTRYEGSIQLAQRVSLVTSLLYRYSFRRVTASSLQIAPELIPLFSQPTRVSLVGATWIRERRDNPADAMRGDFHNVDVSIAGKPIGSSASFMRVFLQDSTFHPLERRFVFARSVRFGVQTPIGRTPSSEIPLPERFFAGGGASLRGFGPNQGGPRDPVTGFPVGGEAMLVFNQELRFPMRLPFVGNRVGGTLFYDAGNVFRSVRRITLRPSVPAPVLSAATSTTPATCLFNCTNELNYLSHTIGFGFRYATPIGPVRVDLAYQLNPAQFVFLNSSGAAQVSRLPRFQFFFNLGSIF
jgi:outer membrane protein assembly factor BamA